MTDETKGCRFRCRTNREAFMAGWVACIDAVHKFYSEFDGQWNPKEFEARAYREWRKGVKGDD